MAKYKLGDKEYVISCVECSKELGGVEQPYADATDGTFRCPIHRIRWTMPVIRREDDIL